MIEITPDMDLDTFQKAAEPHLFNNQPVDLTIPADDDTEPLTIIRFTDFDFFATVFPAIQRILATANAPDLRAARKAALKAVLFASLRHLTDSSGTWQGIAYCELCGAPTSCHVCGRSFRICYERYHHLCRSAAHASTPEMIEQHAKLLGPMPTRERIEVILNAPLDPDPSLGPIYYIGEIDPTQITPRHVRIGDMGTAQDTGTEE